MSEPFLPPEPKPEHEQALPAPVGNQRATRRVVIFSGVLLVILLVGVAGLVMQLDESNERISQLESQINAAPRPVVSKESSAADAGTSLDPDANLFVAPADVAALIAQVGQSVLIFSVARAAAPALRSTLLPRAQVLKLFLSPTITWLTSVGKTTHR